MDASFLFGQDVFIDNSRVGYVGKNHADNAPIYFGGSKLGSLSKDGSIEIKGTIIGFIDDNLSIFIKGRKVGEVKNKDIHFDMKSLTRSLSED